MTDWDALTAIKIIEIAQHAMDCVVALAVLRCAWAYYQGRRDDARKSERRSRKAARRAGCPPPPPVTA